MGFIKLCGLTRFQFEGLEREKAKLKNAATTTSSGLKEGTHTWPMSLCLNFKFQNARAVIFVAFLLLKNCFTVGFAY